VDRRLGAGHEGEPGELGREALPSPRRPSGPAARAGPARAGARSGSGWTGARAGARCRPPCRRR
jgi:hypothetical protein